jgi:hypothetical protein
MIDAFAAVSAVWPDQPTLQAPNGRCQGLVHHQNLLWESLTASRVGSAPHRGIGGNEKVRPSPSNAHVLSCGFQLLQLTGRLIGVYIGTIGPRQCALCRARHHVNSVRWHGPGRARLQHSTSRHRQELGKRGDKIDLR